jgi:hypothetical protein
VLGHGFVHNVSVGFLVTCQKNVRGIDRQETTRKNARARFIETAGDEWSFSPKSQRQERVVSVVQAHCRTCG